MKNSLFRLSFLLIALMSFSFFTVGNKVKTYYSINEALKEPKGDKKLDLMFKGYKQFPSEIIQFKNLEDLVLRGNKIEEIPIEIKKLKKLKELSLGNNPIKDFDLLIETLKTVKKLESLDLEATGIKKVPNSIKELKKLKTLYLWGNPIDSNEISRVQSLIPSVEVK